MKSIQICILSILLCSWNVLRAASKEGRFLDLMEQGIRGDSSSIQKILDDLGAETPLDQIRMIVTDYSWLQHTILRTQERQAREQMPNIFNSPEEYGAWWIAYDQVNLSAAWDAAAQGAFLAARAINRNAHWDTAYHSDWVAARNVPCDVRWLQAQDAAKKSWLPARDAAMKVIRPKLAQIQIKLEDLSQKILAQHSISSLRS